MALWVTLGRAFSAGAASRFMCTASAARPVRRRRQRGVAEIDHRALHDRAALVDDETQPAALAEGSSKLEEGRKVERDSQNDSYTDDR